MTLTVWLLYWQDEEKGKKNDQINIDKSGWPSQCNLTDFIFDLKRQFKL